MHPLTRWTCLGLALGLGALAAVPLAHACERCQPPPLPRDAARIDTAVLLHDLDRRAAAAAAARPSFQFPARVGIARVEHGAVSPIPADEWSAWRDLGDRHANVIAEVSPVSALVAQSLTAGPVSGTAHDAISNLRLAAAREHLDAILLYEVSTRHALEGTELTLLDATIVGAWWFPTHRSHLDAHVTAALIDVRSGLAYGSAIGNATDVCSATLLGSEEKLARQRAATVRKSVAALTPEIAALMSRLARGSPAPDRLGTSWPAERDTPAARPRVVASETDRIIPSPEGDGSSFWRSP